MPLGELHLFIWGAIPINREAAPHNGREYMPKIQRKHAKGSTAVKCGRCQMAEIMGEIRDTPKNGIHR